MSKNTYPQEKALSYLKKYQIEYIDEQIIKSILLSQGYTVIEFNDDSAVQSISEFVTRLGLEENTKTRDCFTYSDAQYRLVFLNGKLSSEEKTKVLALEQWYIFRKRFVNKTKEISEASRRHAHVFAECILNPQKYNKLDRYVKRYHLKELLVIAIIAIVAGIWLLW